MRGNMRDVTSRLLRFLVLLAAIGAMIAIGPVPLQAQSVNGDLVGTVFDATRAGVPNATVTATNTATNIKRTATTNGAGEYRFGNLPAGSYDISATAASFATATLKNVAVQLNQASTANLTMQVGSVATTVEVAEAAAVIDTTTAQIENTFSSICAVVV